MTNITDAEQIRDETAEGANTAARVGSCMVNIATDVAASTASVFSMENFGARLSMVDNATATSITTAGTYYKVLGTTVETFAAGFTLTNNRMTYAPADSIQRAFRITAILSASCATGNHVYRARLAVNGQTDTTTEVVCHVTAGRPSQVGLEGFYVFDSGDYVEVFVTDEDNGEQLTVSHLQMAAQVYPLNAVGSYCFEAQQLFARMPVQPSTTEKNAINTLILALKSPGYFARMDKLLVPRYAVDSDAAVLDWKGGSSASIHGSASWSAEFGFVGSATPGSYINTNFTPSTEASNFTANNGGIGGYITALPPGSGATLWGGTGTPGANQRCVVYFTNSPNNNSFTNTSISGDSGSSYGAIQNTAAGTATTGLIQHNRTTSDLQTLYVNGNSVGTNTYQNANRVLSTRTIYLAAENIDGSPYGLGETKLGAWWMGDDFTPAEQTAIKSAFDTYFNALA